MKYKDGSESGAIGFDSDPADAIALLTDVAGVESVERQIEADSCSEGWHENVRDGLVIAQGTFGVSDSARFDIQVTGSHLGGVRVVSAGGYSIGDSIDALAKSLPGVVVEDFGDANQGSTQIRFDPVVPVVLQPDEDGLGLTYGAQADSTELRGSISLIRSPFIYGLYC